MFKANPYCEEHFVSADAYALMREDCLAQWNATHPEARFSIWNRQRDYDYCRCLTGSYENAAGHTRFYFRCPGSAPAPEYCRQLVYTAGNQLQDGFGEGRKVLS